MKSNRCNREWTSPIETPVADTIISFGGYDWRILDGRDGMALLLSENVIEKRAFNNDKNETKWENCTLRGYLNGEFYDTFCLDDKKRIAETMIINNDNPWYGTKGGGDTKDIIFLLSIEEVVQYFGDSCDLKCRNGWYGDKDSKILLKDRKGYLLYDQYNNARISEDITGAASWGGLRSPGGNSNRAAGVDIIGFIAVGGGNVDDDRGGVRPALWLNL